MCIRDRITVDAENCEINVDVSDTEMTARKAKWKAPAPYTDRGALAKYARLVKSASLGAVTD